MPSKRPCVDDVAYDTHLNACRRLVAGSVFDRDNQVSVPGSMFDFQVPMPRGPLPIVLPASSLYFSAIPDSRVFNEGPCLAGSMVVSATQSSTSCSYSNQLMIPSNPGGILGVMVMPCGSRV